MRCVDPRLGGGRRCTHRRTYVVHEYELPLSSMRLVSPAPKTCSAGQMPIWFPNPEGRPPGAHAQPIKGFRWAREDPHCRLMRAPRPHPAARNEARAHLHAKGIRVDRGEAPAVRREILGFTSTEVRATCPAGYDIAKLPLGFASRCLRSSICSCWQRTTF